MNDYIENIKKNHYIQTVWSASKIYLFWILLHWMSVQIYQYMCVPSTIWGLVFGAAIASQMPHCRAALWTVTHSSVVISNMWIMLGSWLIALFIGKSTESKDVQTDS
tara:strand:- start:924 stop:1244 length:321 start_codon:yes stop_codon:yes gene_type:complete